MGRRPIAPPGPKWRPALPVLTAEHVALELPGTGGLFAYRMLKDVRDVFLQENFVIACGSWREALFAGLVALELRVPSGTRLSVCVDEALQSGMVKGRRYDLVLGSHDRHGEAAAPLADLLAPQGEVVLV